MVGIQARLLFWKGLTPTTCLVPTRFTPKGNCVPAHYSVALLENGIYVETETKGGDATIYKHWLYQLDFVESTRKSREAAGCRWPESLACQESEGG